MVSLHVTAHAVDFVQVTVGTAVQVVQAVQVALAVMVVLVVEAVTTDAMEVVHLVMVAPVVPVVAYLVVGVTRLARDSVMHIVFKVAQAVGEAVQDPRIHFTRTKLPEQVVKEVYIR